MATVKPELPRSAAMTDSVETEVRNLVRGLNQGESLPADPSSEILILKMSSGAIAEIDKLMDELQAARTYLHSEGERVRRMAARYEHLTKTALASVAIISERISQWRTGELAVVASSESGDDHGRATPPDQDGDRAQRAVGAAAE